MRESDSSSNRTDRDEILARLADTIELTHEQIDAIDAETPEDHELLIKWIRAQGYLAGQYRKLLKDEDLDELRETADLLEAAERRRGER